jgi:integrase
MAEQFLSGDPASCSAAAVIERVRALTARPDRITVRELVDRYMADYAGRDPSLPQRLDTWRALIGDRALPEIDSDLIFAVRKELETMPPIVYMGKDDAGAPIFHRKGKAARKTPATLNRYVVAISAVFTWAIEQRLAPRGWVHPCRGLKRLAENNERVRFLDDEERERLFAQCRASTYPRLYALVLTAMLCGARKGELLSLRWRDVDLEAGRAALEQTKNGDRRTLVLLPQVVEALRPFSGEPERFVFGSTRARQARPGAVDSVFREAVGAAKIPDFRFHDLRHCCASYMAQAGQSIHTIADVLGHRKLDMARRYAHLTTDSKAEAMRASLGAIGVRS